MVELVLIACFIAFCLAILEPASEFAALFIGKIATNALVSLSLSALGTYLLDVQFNKSAFVFVPAAAFLGRAFIKTVERITTYKSVIVNNARQ